MDEYLYLIPRMQFLLLFQKFCSEVEEVKPAEAEQPPVKRISGRRYNINVKNQDGRL